MGFFPTNNVMPSRSEFASNSDLMAPRAPRDPSAKVGASPRPAATALEQVLRVLRRDGLWPTLCKGARLLGRRLIRREHLIFFANEVSDTRHEVPANLQGFRFVVVDASNIHCYGAELVSHFRLPADAIDQRIAQGKEAILALREHRVVALVWMAFETQTVDEIGMKLRLLPGEYLTFDAITLHPWRGVGLSRTLNLLADNHVASRGIVQHLAWRSASNASALRVADKLGQRRIASARATWVLGRMLRRKVVSLNRRGSDAVSCLMGL